ncbi:MAG: hypothetical protein WA705_04845 [Candidatus Ozemobacteraceae bacterium]
MFGGRGIAGVLTERQTSGLGLQAKIFAMFFLASWVPPTAFLGIGLSEAADSKDVAVRLWRTRLFQRVDTADRRFRNHLESLQLNMSELVQNLSGQLAAGNQDGIRHTLDKRGFSFRKYSCDACGAIRNTDATDV